MIQRLVALLLTPLLIGCATMRDPTSQVVLVNSVPPGATVLKDGHPVGPTPQLVQVSRRKPSALELDTAQGRQDLGLHRHYRWKGSFWPNLVWYIGAPIAWTVDVLTGTALDFDPLEFPKVELTAKDRAGAVKPPVIIAIAPPRADEPTLSDLAGARLEKRLRERGETVLPYQETLPKFLEQAYDFDEHPPEKDRARLYKNLGATVVYESVLERHDARYLLTTRRNEFAERRVTEDIRIDMDAPPGFESVFTLKRWWTTLIPNVVGLDLAANQTTIGYEGQAYKLSAPEGSFSAQALESLSAIKFTSLPARRLERSLSWSLSLVPTVRLSAIRVTAKEFAPEPGKDANQIYSRQMIGFGYGPEVGVQSGRNYAYFDVLPLLIFGRITSEGRKVERTTLQGNFEFGYIRYLSKHWNVRLFSRTQNESDELWRKALRDRLPDHATLSINTFVGGLSFGYRFEPKLAPGPRVR